MNELRLLVNSLKSESRSPIDLETPSILLDGVSESRVKEVSAKLRQGI